MPHSGQCLCGATKIVVASNHSEQIICHCTDCQLTSGSHASTNILPLIKDVKITGNVKQYDAKAASGNTVSRLFCGEPISFTNAFDLIKVRQQLQVSTSVGTGSTFWGRTLVDMVRSEGVLSIYKGLSASLLREGLYSGIRMGCYDASKLLLLKTVPYADKDSFGVKLGAGMGSGMLGAAVASPADLLKVRMQAVGATGTLRSHARTIFEANGIAGLYRAVFPTILRAGILTASQVGTYDQTKFLLMTDFPGVFREGLPTHLVASGIAGFCCSLASSPGPLSFYKGFTMCFLRLWPHSVLSLLAFEQLRRISGIKPI
ncbi:hypothetical protein P7C70_g8825, partial [Phenoliferia sp. Uapishka_3]